MQLNSKQYFVTSDQVERQLDQLRAGIFRRQLYFIFQNHISRTDRKNS